MSNTVITISRQYGSGGRELSEILAKKLGVKLYDRQIIHMAAAMLGIGDLTDESLRELENKVLPVQRHIAQPAALRACEGRL